MVPITFTLSSVEVPELDAARDRAADLSPAMLAIASYMESETQYRFETGVGPDGVPWTPSKRVQEEGGQTLVLSSHLLRRISSRADATSSEVGTDVIYAAIHNSGGLIRAKSKAAGGAGALRTPFGPRASVNMPRRQFIGFSAEDRVEIPQLLADHLAGSL